MQSGGGNGPGVLVEALLGGFGALLVLAFVFGSFLAIVPILMAIVSIMTTFLVVWGLTTITEVSPIVQFLIALIGLGVSIDYALLVVVRWREERAHGLHGDAAIERAMETAGRAVVFSGTTVAIGLLALVALPLPFLRSVGYGGMLIPLISVLVAMTLLPVVLLEARPAPRLAARARRRQGQPRVDRLGEPRRAPPLDRRARRGRSSWPRSWSPRPACSSASPNLNTLAKQGDAKQRPARARALGHRRRRAAARRGARRTARPRREASRATLAGVPGVHGAVAPERRRLAPPRRRRRWTCSPSPTAPRRPGATTLDRVPHRGARQRRGRPPRRPRRRRTTTSSTPSTATSR